VKPLVVDCLQPEFWASPVPEQEVSALVLELELGQVMALETGRVLVPALVLVLEMELEPAEHSQSP